MRDRRQRSHVQDALGQGDDPVTGSGAPDEALDQVRLRATLNRYLAARTAARHAPDADPSTLVQARLDLVRLLQTAGWEPPASVQASLRADADAQAGPGRRTA